MRASATAILLTSLALLGCAPQSTMTPAQTAPVVPSLSWSMLYHQAAARGAAIADSACASCHAVRPSGVSPSAAAPPFRDVVARRSLDDIETAMAQGLVTTHPDMPAFTFRASEIDDLIAYLETLRQAGPRASGG
jgi:mono/diheme cytochrome c family protein